jgi:NagD protein
MPTMKASEAIEAYLMDMDGVLVRGSQVIPGATDFIERLRSQDKRFLILTNSSVYTPRDLQARLANSGLDVPPEALYTSALATAQFLHDQCPEGSAYVVGESGLTTALHDVGYVLTDQHPDYVVLGETLSYSLLRLSRAITLVAEGARFIATNPDVVGPSEEGLIPATGAVAALIAEATGVKPYFVGKPNPLMMRSALRQLGAHSETSVMIGDRMDTDIVAGTEAGLRTILVLSGVTRREQVDRFPYRPTVVMESVAHIDPRAIDMSWETPEITPLVERAPAGVSGLAGSSGGTPAQPA